MRSGKICTAIVQIFMFYWWGNSKLFPREKENNNKDDNFISDKCQFTYLDDVYGTVGCDWSKKQLFLTNHHLLKLTENS